MSDPHSRQAPNGGRQPDLRPWPAPIGRRILIRDGLDITSSSSAQWPLLPPAVAQGGPAAHPTPTGQDTGRPLWRRNLVQIIAATTEPLGEDKLGRRPGRHSRPGH